MWENITGNTNQFNEKRIFSIDVGAIPEDEIEDYIKKIVKQFKKKVKMETNYMYVEPNSHYYRHLDNFITQSQLSLFPEHNEKEHILTGLLNTLNNGLILKFNEKRRTKNAPPLFFKTIGDMILFVSHESFDHKQFIKLIESSIKNGYDIDTKEVMLRNDVYNILDAERDYQDIMQEIHVENGSADDYEKDVAEWINYMEYHLSVAKNNVYNLSSTDALTEIRKVTALGVRAMEIHGCPVRMLPKKT